MLTNDTQIKILVLKTPLFSDGIVTAYTTTSCVLKNKEKVFFYGNNKVSLTLFLQGIYGKHQPQKGTIEYYASDGKTKTTQLSDKTLTSKNFSVLLLDSRIVASLMGSLPPLARWNSIFKENSPIVKDYLTDFFKAPLYPELENILNISPLLSKQLIALSSGELQRIRLYKTLNTPSKIVLLEQPLAGLDMNFRATFINWLNSFTPKTLVIIADTNRYLSDCIKEIGIHSFEDAKTSDILENKSSTIENSIENHKQPLLSLKEVTVNYGNVQIFNKFSFALNASTRLLLKGANGAGKTTLLSLISGDNPQIYTNDIRIEGRTVREMSSIWEWKKFIGVVNNDLLRAINPTLSVVDIIRSGFTQTTEPIGKNISTEQFAIISEAVLELSPELNLQKQFYQLSHLEKIKTLFVRSVIHQPKLILLDELEVGLTNLDFKELLNLIGTTLTGNNSYKNIACILVSHQISTPPDWITHHVNL